MSRLVGCYGKGNVGVRFIIRVWVMFELFKIVG